jgi:hypothetical protein
MKIRNLKAVKLAIKAHRSQMKQNIRAAVIMVALFVQRESQLIVPVDTGNLKNSASTRPDQSGKPKAEVVYTAAYAIFVHEIERYRHAPGKESKFLVKAVYRNMPRILDIFRKRVEQT